MICIKKKRFSNKIGPSSKTLEENINNFFPASSNQDSSLHDETDDPNRQRESNINCHTDFQTNSDESSMADYAQEPPNTTDDQEVTDIFSEIIV